MALEYLNSPTKILTKANLQKTIFMGKGSTDTTIVTYLKANLKEERERAKAIS